LHLIVEMNLDLKSVQYVVFDEADRLFEMGFETAMNEILHRLPTTRQTLLFSATLPKSLVEFAKAGLRDPKLVRLDAESKISSDLRLAFFSVKQAEKDACLLALLRDVIKVPYGNSHSPSTPDGESRKKVKGKAHANFTAPHQTLVFAATKHHVEYLQTLLTTAGYAVSHIYGTLDHSARTFQMDQFRRGITSVLVVTDVAARGIDIPVLENVVNYDFPHGARVFVHRVGRTARAGRQGWAWSFVTNTELPYLLDLQLFLSWPLKGSVEGQGDQEYTKSMVLGTFQRDKIDEDVEYIRTLDEENTSLPTLREVMRRGHAMYERSKGKASQASHQRAKEMTKDGRWSLAGSATGVHPILLRGGDSAEQKDQEARRKELLRSVHAFTPTETVFELGKKGDAANAALMKERRRALSKAAQRINSTSAGASASLEQDEPREQEDVEMADEADLVVRTFTRHLYPLQCFKSYSQAVFETSSKKDGFRDTEFYMSHYQKDSATDKGWGQHLFPSIEMN
jgi:ATP-dependent RNA helicase DDX54/DBP10